MTNTGARAKGIAKALVVDDDAKILAFVSSHLRSHGYAVEMARNGEEALETAALTQPNVVLLDLAMPVMDGLTALRRLREWYKGPVIILSAHHEEQEKIRALDLGADDYLTKPFSIEELLARVRAALRRAEQWASASTDEPLIKAGEVEIDLAKRVATIKGNQISLTPTEYELLRELAINAGKVISHRELLQKVWGPEYGEETEYLRTFIKQLRRKIEPDPSRPRFILTQPGIGYRFVTS